jgi:hypothetical protein
MVCLLFVFMVTLSVDPAADRTSLPQLAREQGVSPVSTWRWALRGCRGIVLPTFCVGHKRYTTRAAFAEWCAHVTAAANGESAGQVPASRESDIERAEREAARMGV